MPTDLSAYYFKLSYIYLNALVKSVISFCSLSSAALKRRIERTPNRSIFPKTYYNHLKMLVGDNLLNKDDSTGIGKLVFYSLTEEEG